MANTHSVWKGKPAASQNLIASSWEIKQVKHSSSIKIKKEDLVSSDSLGQCFSQFYSHVLKELISPLHIYGSNDYLVT